MFYNYALLWFRACFSLPFRLLISIPAEGLRPFLQRLIIFLLVIPLFLFLNILHLIGFMLDEVLFRSYRNITVKQPVFITGIPRSGTTHLQRMLAHDRQFTTFRTWEVLFAPSITERYFYRFLGSLLSPLGFIASKIRSQLFSSMDDVHFFGLQEAEEDFFILLWIDYCFLSAFLCPASNHYWSLASFCKDVDKKTHEKVLQYYRMCLKKHLYFHGRDLTLLSKNPSFTSCIPALEAVFPESRFVFCVREPERVVPSQLSSLRPLMKLIGNGRLNKQTQTRVLNVLHQYYEIMGHCKDNPAVFLLPMEQLKYEAGTVVCNMYQQLGLPLSDSFSKTLAGFGNSNKKYKASHKYSLQSFGLTEQAVREQFGDVWTSTEKTTG